MHAGGLTEVLAEVLQRPKRYLAASPKYLLRAGSPDRCGQKERGMTSRQRWPWQLLTASLLSSIPASELQLPRRQAGYDHGTALRQGIPGDPASRGVLQPSALSKEAGVERNLRASAQTQGRLKATCTQVDPG